MDSTKAQGPLAKRTATEPLIEHDAKKLKHNDDTELELTAKLAAITEQNKQSPLLRLPGEIRNRIYEYALGGNYIQLQFFYCKSRRILTSGPMTGMDLCTSRHWINLQSLAEVCRSLRSETRILPWALNVLQYIDYPDYESWVKTLTTEVRAAVQNISLDRTCLNSLRTGQLDLSFLPNIRNVFVDVFGLHRRQKQGLLSAAQAKGWHLHFVGDAEICDYDSCVSDGDRYKSEDDDWFEGWFEDLYEDEDEEYWFDDEYE